MNKIYYHHGEFRNINHFKIIKELKKEILGKLFIFRIIGSSHYITTEEGSFSEIFSCIDFGSKNFFLLNNLVKELNFENDFFRVNTLITIKKNMPLKTNFHLYHRFSKNAFTGIKINENSYETIHTYPEFNIVVITKSIFKRK